MPSGGGGVDGGEPPGLVEVGGVPAIVGPRVRVGDNLAVQGAVELVVSEPVPELLPGLQQRVMGNFDTVLSQDEQALGAEGIDDRIGVFDMPSCGMQIGPGAPA